MIHPLWQLLESPTVVLACPERRRVQRGEVNNKEEVGFQEELFIRESVYIF